MPAIACPHKKTKELDSGLAIACFDCNHLLSCHHAAFHFENGGLHMVCNRCSDVYANVGKCPARFIQNIESRSLGLNTLDIRQSPNLIKNT